MPVEFITMIAERTARLENLPNVPRFARWTTSRGHGYKDKFSLPKWIQNKHIAYQIYYVTHEVLHVRYRHGNDMKDAESRILETWGIVPFYADGPYPYKLWDVNTKTYITKFGETH